MLPFPGATANVTATCATGFPFASFTITEGGELTTSPAHTSGLQSRVAAIGPAPPTDLIAVTVPWLPGKVPQLALHSFPTRRSSDLQLPTVATPLALVV